MADSRARRRTQERRRAAPAGTPVTGERSVPAALDPDEVPSWEEFRAQLIAAGVDPERARAATQGRGERPRLGPSRIWLAALAGPVMLAIFYAFDVLG